MPAPAIVAITAGTSRAPRTDVRLSRRPRLIDCRAAVSRRTPRTRMVRLTTADWDVPPRARAWPADETLGGSDHGDVQTFAPLRRVQVARALLLARFCRRLGRVTAARPAPDHDDCVRGDLSGTDAGCARVPPRRHDALARADSRRWTAGVAHRAGDRVVCSRRRAAGRHGR